MRQNFPKYGTSAGKLGNAKTFILGYFQQKVIQKLWKNNKASFWALFSHFWKHDFFLFPDFYHCAKLQKKQMHGWTDLWTGMNSWTSPTQGPKSFGNSAIVRGFIPPLNRQSFEFSLYSYSKDDVQFLQCSVRYLLNFIQKYHNFLLKNSKSKWSQWNPFRERSNESVWKSINI